MGIPEYLVELVTWGWYLPLIRDSLKTCTSAPRCLPQVAGNCIIFCCILLLASQSMTVTLACSVLKLLSVSTVKLIIMDNLC